MKVTGAKRGKRGVRTIRGRKGGRRGGARRPRRGGPQNERRKKHRNGKAQENAGAAGGRVGGPGCPRVRPFRPRSAPRSLRCRDPRSARDTKVASSRISPDVIFSKNI